MRRSLVDTGMSDSGSGRAGGDHPVSAAQGLEWLRQRRGSRDDRVSVVAIERLCGWAIDPVTGNLAHESSRFFSIRGLRVWRQGMEQPLWEQPIIDQPEQGIVGFLVRGPWSEPELLVQAKMEPGNINLVQLSPTLQATHSNYSRVHGGSIPAYLDCFTGHPHATVIVDELQSEQSTRFFRKQNRTMVVGVPHDFADDVGEDFGWMPLGTVLQLLHAENTVNMNARSVLASLWAARVLEPGLVQQGATSEFGTAVLRSATASLEEGEHAFFDFEDWLGSLRQATDTDVALIPLRQVQDWVYDGFAIRHRAGDHFSIIGAEVTASGREVTQWQQPLLSSVEINMNALVCQSRGGLLHVLVRAQDEPGTLNGFELAPTVQRAPSDPATGPGSCGLRDVFTDSADVRILYDRLLSEEGGRFYHDENRYRIVLIDERAVLESGDECRWMTVAQLLEFVRRGSTVNMEARTLVACLWALTVGDTG